jgi:holo-[acyl-carrier protein] synthase
MIPAIRIGIDVVEVERIARAMQNPRFLPRILADAEQIKSLTPQRVAGRWAAKEAIAKALQTRPGWHDVIIVNDSEGAPSAHIAPNKLPVPGGQVILSISHERGLAVAVAIFLPPA